MSLGIIQLLASAIGGGGAVALLQFAGDYLSAQSDLAGEFRADLADRVERLHQRVDNLSQQLQNERLRRVRAEAVSQRLLVELNKLRRRQGMEAVELEQIELEQPIDNEGLDASTQDE